MTWPFSLPPSIIKENKLYRILNNTNVNYAYSEFEFVFPIKDDRVWYDTSFREEFDLWCQHNHCYYFYDRVLYDRWAFPKRRWVTNGIGGFDLMFIATNYESGATMAKLTWNEVDANEYQY